MNKLVALSNGFSGAEIEETVIAGMYDAARVGHDDHDRAAGFQYPRDLCQRNQRRGAVLQHMLGVDQIEDARPFARHLVHVAHRHV